MIAFYENNEGGIPLTHRGSIKIGQQYEFWKETMKIYTLALPHTRRDIMSKSLPIRLSSALKQRK